MMQFTSQQELLDFLNQHPDPVSVIRNRLCEKVFGNDTQNAPAFQDMRACMPTLTDNTYHGDAVEFMNGELHDPYTTLQDMMKKMRDSLQVLPTAGESIVGYLDRLIQKSLEAMQK